LKLLTRQNVIEGITDQTSVLYLRDQDIANRINFLLDPAQALDPDWFTQEVFSAYSLLISVADKKQLFSPKTRGKTLPEFQEIIDKTKDNSPISIDFPKPGSGRDGKPC
jgi:hypothetical protein